MRRLLIIAAILMASVYTYAQMSQKTITRTTVYEKFQPAYVTMKSGKVLTQSLSNIFLGNGKLVFKRGVFTMEAKMDQIKEVVIADQRYVCADTMLTVVVDTMGSDRLLCATLIDIESFQYQMKNDRSVTNFEVGEMVGITTLDQTAEEDYVYPLMNVYFFEVKGKFYRAHERIILRMLTKDNRRQFRNLLSDPEFSWSNKDYLMRILNLMRKS